MNSDDIKKMPAARALLYGTRLDKKQIEKPVIAIVFSQNEICPGHVHLYDLAECVQRGIAEAGGTGIRMNIGVGICDGIAMGHDGMKYSLPSREINRDCVIDMVKAHGIFDGIVYVAACDKNIPGYLMAAACLDIPGIFVTTGPMMPGYIDGKGADVVTSFAADAQYALKKISEEEYERIIEESCPTVGSCAGLFTANSMACVTEALGLTVPGMATAHAISNKKYRLATESGRQVMELVKKKITTKDILCEDAFHNALSVDMAIGASTNTVLHVPAIAKEAGFDFNLERINELSKKAPNILRLSPASEFRMIDLENAGGIPLIMKRLKPILNTQIKTVTGTLEERLNSIKDDGNTNVIRTMANPFSKTGGIAIYKGNIAPGGAVIKESAVDSSIPVVFKGKARVFNDELGATDYIKAGKVQKGDVIIIRYEGPAGGPGMREMLYPTSAIIGLKLDKDTALITDGRFSGGTAGICIGHVEPEAYNGGPIAFIENGDEIIIDRKNKTINHSIDDKELQKRKSGWKRVGKEATSRLLEKYREEWTR